MTEILVTIEGLDETWQDWVLPKGKEEYDELSTRLQPIVRSLARRPVELTPVDKLVEYYDDIDRLMQDPDAGVTAAETAVYLSRITQRVQDVTTAKLKERPAFRELPLHIGAVFEKGRNYLLVEHESIPTMKIKNADHRQAYILENLHAFNTLFKQPQSWKPAVDIWLTDAMFAAKAENLKNKDLEEFSEQLKAMMAITASARAMEESAGASVSYLVVLTGGERGNLSAQDTMSDFLIHADLDKLNEVIDNPLVKKYYDILMNDAGLINNAETHRWRKIPDPNNSEKKIELPSKVELVEDSKEFRDKVRTGKLVPYLKDFAEKGGFDTYIREVLLKKDTPAYIRKLKKKGIEEDSRWEAAKLACDAFLIDQWTRWENIMTDKDRYKEKGERKVEIAKDLNPAPTWGGDPLKSILKPSFLPRLKGVYSEKDEVILDLTDSIFRPEDIFQGDLEEKIMVPSMVTNLKRYARMTEAISTFFGGSMATSIPSWDRKTMEEDVPQIISLLTQIYGKTKGGNEKAKTNTGKHIVGAMSMKLLYTKALASAIETTKPGFSEKIQILFNPQAETRPFLDVMGHLYGVKLDGKSGFIRSLVSGRTRLVIKGNKFGAEDIYKKTWEVLQTNDQTTGHGQAGALNKVGFLIDIAQSLAEGFAGYKKR
jgi:hypothetical protein